MNFEEFTNFPGPCQPIRIENYIPVYDSEQVDLYGQPENWGIVSYLVIQTRGMFFLTRRISSSHGY